MFEKIQSIIAEQLGIEPETVTLTSHLVNDLKADSLDIVALVMEIEEEYGLEIPDDALLKMQTPQDLINYIEANT